MNPETRDAVRVETITSAAACLPLILSFQDAPERGWGAWPDGILDVGAGEGHWGREAHRLRPRASIIGVDVEADTSRGFPFTTAWDAENGDPLPLRGGPGQPPDPPEETSYSKWPLALCLEVIEHLTPDAGAFLVGELCRVADVIAFSAAVPGQGGDGHLNEQPPSHWHDLFREQGYALVDPWRLVLWDEPGVAPWYAQNLLAAIPAPTWGVAPVRHLIHPAVFQTRLDQAAYWRQEYLDAEARLKLALRGTGARP